MREGPMRRAFRGLGTDLELRLWPLPGRETLAALRLAAAVRFLRRAEARLSRFQPESELSRVNRASGRPVHISRLLLAVTGAALAAARATDGLFDPTVLNALLAAGYDRSFDKLERDGARHSSRTTPGAFAGRWRSVELDRHAQTLRLP